MVVWLGLVVAVASIINCVGDDGRDDGHEAGYRAEFGGQQSVYDRISVMSDCGRLQEEFDIAATNNDSAAPGSDEHRWTRGYMAAAGDRMETIGCYD